MRLSTLALSLGLLGACASTGGGKPSVQVNALYSQLEQACKGYETALQQSREGNLEASQLTLKPSSELIIEVAPEARRAMAFVVEAGMTERWMPRVSMRQSAYGARGRMVWSTRSRPLVGPWK
mgnify:CR=1 FL=1